MFGMKLLYTNKADKFLWRSLVTAAGGKKWYLGTCYLCTHLLHLLLWHILLLSISFNWLYYSLNEACNLLLLLLSTVNLNEGTDTSSGVLDACII